MAKKLSFGSNFGSFGPNSFSFFFFFFFFKSGSVSHHCKVYVTFQWKPGTEGLKLLQLLWSCFLMAVWLIYLYFLLIFNIGWFHVNEGQPCHPCSQILIKLCSNVPTYKKQKWAIFFHLTLNSSWDIGFWNLGNFRTFFQKSAILNFPYLKELLYKANLHENLHLCTFLGGESKNHIKNWPWALETGLTLN